MAWPAGSSSTDFWADDFGAAAAETWVFEGWDGLGRLTGPQTISAPDPEEFRARLTRVQLDHVALEHFAATAHSLERGAAEIAAYPTPLLTVIHLLDGVLDLRLAQVRFRVNSGQSIVIDSRRPVSASSSGPVSALRSVVGVEHVPAALQTEDATVAGPLPHTALLTSFTAFVGTVLRSTRQDQHPHGPQLIAAIAQLQTAVLAEAQDAVQVPRGAAGLRYRIEEHIQQHHTDPRLDVAAIARAVDVSVRHAHGVFNQGDRTIAAVLRDRRVATAAEMLRSAEGAVNLADLAAQAGFSDRDTFSRAFKHRYGMTPTDYHRGGHRNLG